MQKSLKTALRFLLKFLVAAAAWFGAVLALAIMGGVTQITSIGWFAALVYVLAVVILPIIVAIIAFHRSFRKDFRIPFVKNSTYVEPLMDQVSCNQPPPPQELHINHAIVEAIVDRFNSRHNPPAPHRNILDEYSKYGGIDAEMLTIDLMDGHSFEYWCASALKDMGYTDVEVTPGSGDQGVDILATKDGLKYAIQCKRYASDLGNTPVQEVYSGKAMYHCHVAAVLSNRYFTSGAQALANSTGVLLWDRDWILRYLKNKQNSDGSIQIEHLHVTHSPANPDYDELLPAAVDVILDANQATISVLQRRLLLGYARCARIMADLEDLNIVSSFQGDSPRTILINNAEWQLICKRIF